MNTSIWNTDWEQKRRIQVLKENSSGKIALKNQKKDVIATKNRIKILIILEKIRKLTYYGIPQYLGTVCFSSQKNEVSLDWLRILLFER